MIVNGQFRRNFIKNCEIEHRYTFIQFKNKTNFIQQKYTEIL